MSVDNANIFKNTQIYFDPDSLSVILENMRKRIFQFLQEDQQLKQEEAKKEGQLFVDNSLLKLEERLKKHYPLKGQIETEIY